VADSVEGQLSSLFGYEYAVLFGRARAGLVAIFDELGKRSAPALIPSNVCVAVLAAVRAAGKEVTLVSVAPTSGLADDERLASAVENSKADFGIVMPTHLYGMWADYPRTRRVASERGWFILENDSLGASIGLASRAASNALLLSFGAGKTIDAGSSGAVLTNDAAFAKAIGQRAKNWPIASRATDLAELNATLARRYLHALDRADLGEPILETDAAFCRNGFDERQRPNISAALARFPHENAARVARLEIWHKALSKLAPDVEQPEVPIRTPWRAIFRVREQLLRNAIVDALRSNGFDAGTNYPPLTDFFPKLLAGQAQPDAQTWGKSVLTLWLDESYDDDRIGRAAAIIAGVVARASEEMHD
jgi:dTDP-4-amino-4,6-dideoxygalactose transaminase